jgi:hypothetical protein
MDADTNTRDNLVRELDRVAFVDKNNISDQPLLANGVFTGQWSYVAHYNTVKILLSSDTTGTLYVEHAYSKDAPLYIDTVPFTGMVVPNISKLYSQWYRLVYINGGTNQTTMTISAIVCVYER